MAGLSLDYRLETHSERSFRGARMTQPDMNMGFWEGRQQRAYHEITANTQLRFVAGRDFLLTFQNLYIEDGSILLRVFTGSTPAGVWTPVTTVVQKNRIGAAAANIPLNALQSGGTFSGGTERERLRVDAGAGQGVGFENRLGGVRGLPAGTYYFDFTSPGAVLGLYSLEWEELDTIAGEPV